MAPWDKFFNDKVKQIFTQKKSIIDIGGGLRISKKQGNRFDPGREWIVPLAAKTDYKILDPVADFSPDIVGDIHDLPFTDGTQEAIICLAVLEHVENPLQAVSEMHRTLVFGGYCLAYVPFLYYYHAEKGYYKDFWRFSRDAVEFLFKDFSHVEIQAVRGAVETWIKISPLGRFGLINHIARWIDQLSGKSKSKQVSGFYIFAEK